jgi:hypothetical protein
MGIGVFFFESKAAQVKNGETIPQLSIRFYAMVLNKLSGDFYIFRT